jgi:hypothetical protein
MVSHNVCEISLREYLKKLQEQSKRIRKLNRYKENVFNWNKDAVLNDFMQQLGESDISNFYY